MKAPESAGARMNDQESLTSLLEKAAKYRAMAQEATGNKTLRDALEAVAQEADITIWLLHVRFKLTIS
jgi:hypothetical protein